MKRLWMVLLVLACALAACNTPTQSSSAVDVVLNFVNVRVTGDDAKLVALTCKDSESWARTQAAGFKQGNTTVQSVSCKEDGKDGAFTVVRCTGAMVKSYGGENTTIDLAGRAFRTVQEDNQWRVCGYTK